MKRKKKRGRLQRTLNHCLNCGTGLSESDKFCPTCGQKNEDQKVSLKQLLLDFLGDYFTFDSKLFRSIVPLLFKPGFLTSEYNSGKRATYIPPLRLYIFISFVYFFIAGIAGNSNTDTQPIQITNTDSITSGTNVRVNTGTVGLTFKGGALNYSADELEEIANDEIKFNSFLDTIGVEKTPFKIMATKIVLRQVVKFRNQQDSFSSYFTRNISLLMFFLMPLFALILMLIYHKQKKFYIEHLIFSFHFHSFVFILLIISEILDFEIVQIIIVPLMFAYFFFALAKTYPASSWKTLFKGLLVGLLYLISLSAAMILTLIFSFIYF